MQIGLSSVHKVQKDLEVICSGAIEDDEELVVDRDVDRILVEQFGKVGAASRQHESMRFEGLT